MRAASAIPGGALVPGGEEVGAIALTSTDAVPPTVGAMVHDASARILKA